MPTLADVAKVAGVGVMSVSRVVNGTRKVSKSTEEKVRAAIRRIGYEPNEAAKVLKGHRARVLGLIVPDLADPFFAVCANAIQVKAREAGYMTLMVASGHQESVERQQTDVMMQRQVAGMIVIPTGSANDHLTKAMASGLQVVALDRPLRTADSVLVDNRDASARIVRHLLEHGHQHILCVQDEYDVFTKRERFAGYLQAVRRAKRPARVCIVGPKNGTVDEQLPSILASRPKLTAIFTGSDLVTVGVLRYLKREGLKIPQDVALVAFDTFDAAALVSRGITLVRQPIVELAHKAVSLLLKRIEESNSDPAVHVVLNADLIIRESCGCGTAKAPSKPRASLAKHRATA